MDFSVAFIFDMDGVIVDSNPVHKIALKQFCQEHGYELTDQQLREKIYGRTNKDWITKLFGKLEEAEVKKFGEEKEALFRKLYENEIRPLEGLIPFLEKLDEYQIPRAIATSAPRANVDFTLEKTGTGRFFSTILDDTFVSRGKPDPEIYLKSAQALNFPPNRCVVFEDSLSGVEAAKRAGCKVVGVMTTHKRQELTEVDLVVDDFQEFDPKELIEWLF